MHVIKISMWLKWAKVLCAHRRVEIDIRNRVDSRARECENPAYFVILAQNCDLGAPTIPQSTEKWRIFVSFVRIVVLFSTILVVNFRSFPLISIDPVVRDLTETSILLAETVNACAYGFLFSLSLTQDGVEIYSFLACDNLKTGNRR